jgi:hypothetical protein
MLQKMCGKLCKEKVLIGPTLFWAMPNRKGWDGRGHLSVPNYLNIKTGFYEARKNSLSKEKKMVALGPGPTSHCLTQADGVHPDVGGCHWQPRRPLPGRTPEWRRGGVLTDAPGRRCRSVKNIVRLALVCRSKQNLSWKEKVRHPEREKLDIAERLSSFSQKPSFLRQRVCVLPGLDWSSPVIWCVWIRPVDRGVGQGGAHRRSDDVR